MPVFDIKETKGQLRGTTLFDMKKIISAYLHLKKIKYISL